MLSFKHVSIALALVVAGLSVNTYILSLKLSASEQSVLVEKEGRKKDAANYKAAQAEAESLAIKAKAKKELEDAKKAAEADERTEYWRRKFDASILRYKALGSKSGPTNLPGPSPVAEGSDGPSGDPGLFISMKDANTCADNTARLLSIHEMSLKPR